MPLHGPNRGPPDSHVEALPHVTVLETGSSGGDWGERGRSRGSDRKGLWLCQKEKSHRPSPCPPVHGGRPREDTEGRRPFSSQDAESHQTPSWPGPRPWTPGLQNWEKISICVRVPLSVDSLTGTATPAQSRGARGRDLRGPRTVGTPVSGPVLRKHERGEQAVSTVGPERRRVSGARARLPIRAESVEGGEAPGRQAASPTPATDEGAGGPGVPRDTTLSLGSAGSQGISEGTESRAELGA